MNNELERIGKEGVVTKFKEPLGNFLGGAVENHEKTS
jgi:hypothetical protein